MGPMNREGGVAKPSQLMPASGEIEGSQQTSARQPDFGPGTAHPVSIHSDVNLRLRYTEFVALASLGAK